MGWVSGDEAYHAGNLERCRKWKQGDTEIRLAVYGVNNIMIFYTPVNYRSMTGQ